MSRDRPDLHRRRLLAGLTAGAALAAPALVASPATSLRPRARPGSGAGPDLTAERPRPRPGSEAARQRSVPTPEQVVADARLGGKVAYVVADARTGEVLEARNPLLPQPPASVAKAMTALYALDALGGAYRFRTRLLAHGQIVGGRLSGDLILAGSGDPTLDTNALADLAARLKAAGVTEVTGRLLIYDGALPRIDRIDPAQPDHVGYNPALSGLNLNFNRVHFEWKRAGNGYTVTMDARSNTYRPDVRVAQMQVVRRSTPIYTYEDAGDTDVWTVASGALGSGGARWLPVREPALYCAEVFQTFARSQGIALGRPERISRLPSGTAPITQFASGDLRGILADMLNFSTNVTAEAVGLAASATRGATPATLAASGARMSQWLAASLGGRRPDFVDHSGLGDRSRISATDLVRALVALGPGAQLDGILKDIPMRDAAYKRVDSHPARVIAKTGTLNFVSGLGGYVRLPGNRDLAFAIFSADMPRREGIPRAQREAPEGARGWARRARVLQFRLLDRWSVLYGA